MSTSVAFQTDGGRTSIRTFSRFTSPRDTRELQVDGKVAQQVADKKAPKSWTLGEVAPETVLRSIDA